tara:strand:- start:9812 stop:10003 length:192 start_codon:yes stop_codon:yes gene_type:complete
VKREIRNIVNLKGTKASVSTGIPALGDLPEGVPQYRFIKGKGMYQFLKHNGVIYNSKFNKGGL